MAIRRAAHAVYELNYHFVWPPKYRKGVLTKEVKKFLEDLFPKVARAYGFEIIEQNVQPDHLHLYTSAPPRIAPAQIVDILKSISAREVFKKFPKVKQQLWGGELWSDGYFVRAVGDKVTAFIIQRYIKYQHHEHSAKQGRLF
jgi:putative transposase